MVISSGAMQKVQSIVSEVIGEWGTMLLSRYGYHTHVHCAQVHLFCHVGCHRLNVFVLNLFIMDLSETDYLFSAASIQFENWGDGGPIRAL